GAGGSGETTGGSEMVGGSGKIGWVSNSGPSLAGSLASTSSTQKMAWGLPMLTTDGERKIGLSIDPICSSMARVSSNFSASGISFQAKRGLPMSTVETTGLSPFQQPSSPPVDSSLNALLPVSLNSSSAMQRMPLPQAPASDPSLL